jgi:RNA polymerase sigma-70 factor (ECF subfamily)
MQRLTVAETEDDVLIRSAASGDREAFGQIYQRYSQRVFRHASFLTGDTELAEDITAQVFLKALEAIPRYESRGVPFVAWLLRITGNMVINHRKSHKNDGHAQLPESLETDDAHTSPENCAELKLDGQRVWREVRKLPCDQRQVITMRFIDDLSYLDIANALGKTIGAVRVIQFRALANLRHMMQDELAIYHLAHAAHANGNGHTSGAGYTNGNGHSNGNGHANGNGRALSNGNGHH